MSYIDSGKKDGATIHVGGARHGEEGYFIQPTIFTGCTPEMKIIKEEIFGPVAAVVKFKTEEGPSIPGCVLIGKLIMYMDVRGYRSCELLCVRFGVPCIL